jgi:carboxylesterase
VRRTTIPGEIRTHPRELPVFLQGNRGEGVLILHGYTAGPGEVRYLGERLNEAGFTVSIPRLPGHGTRKEDLLTVSWRDWLRRALDAYMDLAPLCRQVHVVGFSMGGILAVLTAARLSVSRLVLIAPGILNRNRLILFSPLLAAIAAPFLPYLRKPRPTKAGIPGLEHLEQEYWRWTFIRPIASVFTLQRMARHSLRRITCPALVIASRCDRVVPEKVADFIVGRIGSREIRTEVFESFPHRMVMEEGKEEVAELVIQFLENTEQNG